jgi:DNA-binding CsgD family transcriptional regulator
MLNPHLEEASQHFALKYGMTPREHQVFNLFLAGLSPEEASAQLQLSLNTVRNHVKGLLRGTQTNTVNMLLAKFIRETFDRLTS